MKFLRRKRLNELLKSPRFNGDRSAFLASSGLSKGRLTQLLNPSEPFGDTAARNLCEALGLPFGWFDSAARFPPAESFQDMQSVQSSAPPPDYKQNQPVALMDTAQPATNNVAMPPECQVLCSMFLRLPEDKRDAAFAGIVEAINRAKDPPTKRPEPEFSDPTRRAA